MVEINRKEKRYRNSNIDPGSTHVTFSDGIFTRIRSSLADAGFKQHSKLFSHDLQSALMFGARFLFFFEVPRARRTDWHRGKKCANNCSAIVTRCSPVPANLSQSRIMSSLPRNDTCLHSFWGSVRSSSVDGDYSRVITHPRDANWCHSHCSRFWSPNRDDRSNGTCNVH